MCVSGMGEGVLQLDQLLKAALIKAPVVSCAFIIPRFKMVAGGHSTSFS